MLPVKLLMDINMTDKRSEIIVPPDIYTVIFLVTGGRAFAVWDAKI